MAPSEKELEDDIRRLINELYYFDNLRVDRTTSAWGLEVRIPFLDSDLVDYVLQIPTKYKKCDYGRIEKKILRDAFQNDALLPEEILYRNKEAFSDAVSSNEESWYKALVKNYIEPLIDDKEFERRNVLYPINTPQTKEAFYYRSIFAESYPDRDNVIPHYWMPNWVDCKNDPSATVLECHSGIL